MIFYKLQDFESLRALFFRYFSFDHKEIVAKQRKIIIGYLVSYTPRINIKGPYCFKVLKILSISLSCISHKNVGKAMMFHLIKFD